MLNHNNYRILHVFVVAAIALVMAIMASGCTTTDYELLPSRATPTTPAKQPSCTTICDTEAVNLGPTKAAECVKACFAARGIVETTTSAEYARETNSAIWNCDTAYPYEQFNKKTGRAVGPKQIHRQLITFTYGTKRLGQTGMYAESFSASTHELTEFFHHQTQVFRGMANPYAPDIRGRLQGLAWKYAGETTPVPPNRYMNARNFDVRTFDIGNVSPYVVCWQPLIDVEPDRSAWPNAGLWQSRRAHTTPPPKVAPKARQWYTKTNSFIEIIRGDATVYTCHHEIVFKDKIATSDGWELGPLQYHNRKEDLVIGPLSHANSQMTMALQFDVSISTKVQVNVVGNCWPLGAAKPEQPMGWSGHYTW